MVDVCVMIMDLYFALFPTHMFNPFWEINKDYM